MAAVDVYLSIGTNLGNRRRNIRIALNLLDMAIGTHYSALSSIVESKASGFTGPDFLDCVVCYRTARSPQTLLQICKRIERQMGRTDAPEYAEDGSRIYHDRIIDIDILLYGKRKIDTPELTVPHPRMQDRDFIMGPLKEIFDQK